MNETKAEGFFDEAKGKIKSAWGDMTGDTSAQVDGAADQVKGNAEQGWGNVKEAAHDASHDSTVDRETLHSGETTTTSHGLGDDISSGAQHVKENIQQGLDNLKHRNDD